MFVLLAFACYREATSCGQYIAIANSIEQCCNQYNGVAYARVNSHDYDDFYEVTTLPPLQCTPCVISMFIIIYVCVYIEYLW